MYHRHGDWRWSTQADLSHPKCEMQDAEQIHHRELHSSLSSEATVSASQPLTCALSQPQYQETRSSLIPAVPIFTRAAEAHKSPPRSGQWTFSHRTREGKVIRPSPEIQLLPPGFPSQLCEILPSYRRSLPRHYGIRTEGE